MIVLVEDNLSNIKCFTHLLKQFFPNSEVKSFPTGIQAINFIKTNNDIRLVVLDGNLARQQLETKPCNGPDVAAEILEKKIIPIAVWTDDEVMLARFSELFKQIEFTRHFTMSKPCKRAEFAELVKFVEATLEHPEADHPESMISVS
jgi:CheY-like chemotaxis protein